MYVKKKKSDKNIAMAMNMQTVSKNSLITNLEWKFLNKENFLQIT